MSWNIFESNSQEFSPEGLAAIGDKEFVILPPLSEGQWYELMEIGNRVVVVIEQG